MSRTRILTMLRHPLRMVITAMILLGALLTAIPAGAQVPNVPTPSPRVPRRTQVPIMPRATPAPTPAAGAAATPAPTPPVPGMPPGAPGAPGAVPPPGAPGQPGRVPVPVPSPATAPQLLYEAAPTTTTIRKISGTSTAEPAGAQSLPTSEPSQVRVTLALKAKSLDEVFNSIREKYGVRIKSQGTTGATQIPTVVARDVPLETLLDQLAREHQWTWVQREDGTYEMHDKDSIKSILALQTRIKVFQLHFIDAEELMKVVDGLKTPEIGTIAADARSNKLIVTDVPSKIALIESIIREYDVQVYTRVFEIKHATVDSIQTQLETIKSKAGEMHVDPVNRVIIVKDTIDKIKQMEELVQILDRDVEMAVYNMLNIGTDGQAVEDFVSKFIEPLKTQSDTAVMQYSRDTGKLFVRDVHAVHEKILQIMRQVDVPTKQVRIEGEIVSVAISHDLSIGTEWAFSSNLKDAINLGQGQVQSFLGTGGTGSSTDTSFTPTAFNTKGLPLVTVGSGGLKVLELTDDVKMQLNAALTDTRTRLLLRPRITIKNNEEGRFRVISSQPVLQTFNYGYNTGVNNNASSQATYDSGLQVSIKPTISNRGLVEMQIQFVNSTPIIVPDIGNGIRGVGSSEESAETVCVIPSGETRVIGGLISRDNTEGQSGVPYLSQIPYLGFLFGKKTKTINMRNLMFFITPTVIEEQPINDLIVEPVNDAARISMQQAQQAGAPPASVSGTEIPPELRPYLKELQPQPKPLPEAGPGETSATLSGTAPLPRELQGTVTDDETPTTTSMANGSQFLTNQAYATGETPITELRMGGTLPGGGAAPVMGPSGVFGESSGGAAGRGGAVAGGAARPGTGARGAGAAAATPNQRAGSGARGGGSSSGRQSFGSSQYNTSRMRGGSMGSGPMGFGSETSYR